jgi:predicted Fe-S protein YdhL (DUF1289 family)
LTVASPCNKICRLDATGNVCVGCWRTLGEIEHWSNMDAAARQRVIDDLPRRAVILAEFLREPETAPAAV